MYFFKYLQNLGNEMKLNFSIYDTKYIAFSQNCTTLNAKKRLWDFFYGTEEVILLGDY